MKNILSKWNITPEELNQATDELCAKGIAKVDVDSVQRLSWSKYTAYNPDDAPKYEYV